MKTPDLVVSHSNGELSAGFLSDTKRRIEAAVVPAMEHIYGHGEPGFSEEFRPGLKRIEKVVSFYDYWACGISVLAPLALSGSQPAQRLLQILQNNMEHYGREVHGHVVEGHGVWMVPLRRLLLHIALAYRVLEHGLADEARKRFRDLVEQQVPLAIACCGQFHPERADLYLAGVNNHTAIFMQGIWYCGQVFDRPDWSRLASEFAGRYYASGHPDGYFEEHTNAEREGGPSLVYTTLTAGSLYDVLDGQNQPRQKFVKAGDFFRAFLNHRREMIPIADERTNANGAFACYGLALHSLTSRGRAFIRESLEQMDYAAASPETLAVVYHEIDLMQTGPTEMPEYCSDGACRIKLPLGVVRGHGFTAGLSALRALNRTMASKSDYALDQQDMVYLSHCDAGVILTGFKSKLDPEYSTFRIGDDGYTVRTGALVIGEAWAEATLYYETFTGTLRWDLGLQARLTLRVDTDRPVITTLPATRAAAVCSAVPVEVVSLKGFSPYSMGNTSPEVPALQFRWEKELVLEFAAPDCCSQGIASESKFAKASPPG
ncbi:MAG: hypothetical protein WCL16_08555 [bacterium]